MTWEERLTQCRDNLTRGMEPRSMASDERQLNIAVAAIAEDFVDRFLGVVPSGDNAYETAANRYERVNDATPVLLAVAEKIKELANEEWDSAVANLRIYESQPGIPLPEYRWWAPSKDAEHDA